MNDRSISSIVFVLALATLVFCIVHLANIEQGQSMTCTKQGMIVVEIDNGLTAGCVLPSNVQVLK